MSETDTVETKRMKAGITLISFGSAWLGAGLLGLYLFVTVELKLANLGLQWSFDTEADFFMAGIPIGTVLLLLGILRIRRLIK